MSSASLIRQIEGLLADVEHCEGEAGRARLRQKIEALRDELRRQEGHAEPASEASVISMAFDVTERRRIERALCASEERFRSVLESSLDAAYRRNLQPTAMTI